MFFSVKNAHYSLLSFSLISCAVYAENNEERFHQNNANSTNSTMENLLLNHYLIAILAVIIIIFSLYNWKRNRPKFKNHQLFSLFESLTPWIILDDKHRIIRLNKEFTTLNGYTLKDLRGTPPFPSLLFSDSYENKKNILKSLQKSGMWQGEISVIHKDSSILTQIVTIREIRQNNHVKYIVISFVDITNRKKIEEKLRTLSERDGLTGLWNRRKFDEALRKHCKMIDRYPNKERSCLAIIDIDNFKSINDSMGHDYGDFIIRELATLLKFHLRDTDMVARVGGEEFAVILRHTQLTEATVVLKRVCQLINDTLPFTISGGVSEISKQQEHVYKHADIALYQAKRAGKNQIMAFDEPVMVSDIAPQDELKTHSPTL